MNAIGKRKTWWRPGVAALALGIAPSLAAAQCKAAWHVESGALGSSLPIWWVRAATMYRGELYLGGDFSTPVPYLARRQAEFWSPVGSGVPYPVYALLAWNDRLIVGGQAAVREWDGQSLVTIGALVSPTWSVHALGEWNGDLYAGGRFTSIGGISASRIARWDGHTWSPLGTGVYGTTDPYVYDIGTFDGQLVVGGDFWRAGSRDCYNIARWNGSSWSEFGGGLLGVDSSPVHATCVYQGDLYAGGYFDFAPGSGAMRQISRWNGTQWQAVGAPNAIGQIVYTMRVWNDELIVGGDFQSIGGLQTSSIARWNGSEWRPMNGGGVNYIVGAMTERDGELVVAGYIETAGTLPAGHWALYGCTCYPDCNTDGSLNLSDFGCFRTKFSLGDPQADCNADGVLNLSDFGCFQTKFALGCP